MKDKKRPTEKENIVSVKRLFFFTIKLLLKAAILDLTSFLNDLFIYILKREQKPKN